MNHRTTCTRCGAGIEKADSMTRNRDGKKMRLCKTCCRKLDALQKAYGQSVALADWILLGNGGKLRRKHLDGGS